MNNDRHKNPNYYKNYNEMRSKIIIHCECGKDVKKSCMHMHQKTRVHQMGLKINELQNKLKKVSYEK